MCSWKILSNNCCFISSFCSNNHGAYSFLLLRRRALHHPPTTATTLLVRSLPVKVRCQQQILPVKAEAEYLELQAITKIKEKEKDGTEKVEEEENEEEEEEVEEEEDDDEGISGIQVPRQGYLAVSKSNLMSALLSSFFKESQQHKHLIAADFTLFASCLDSILHAEHKAILEEMRIDYFNPSTTTTTHSSENKSIHTTTDNKQQQQQQQQQEEKEISMGAARASSRPGTSNYSLDFKRFLLGSSSRKRDTSNNSADDSSIAVPSRFQRAFLKLLHDAQFEELSTRDLLLTSALNTDYLLTLPIYVDWKRASASNIIIFRRGYATERQKGLLIVEKLDYLQSRLLQGVFFSLSKPLGRVGMLIKEALESASQRQELQIWTERLKIWLEDLSSQQSYSDNETPDNQLVSDQLSSTDLPIWLAAQRAVPRYEGLLSSVGPRGRLLRKLLTWIGFIPSKPRISLQLDSDNTTSELHSRPSFLSRISLGDIWRPATREQCGNDFLKMLKTSISILFSQSTLQEPAFQELILLYNEESGQRETEDKADIPSLMLKIYEKIPIPDLQVVFPHKRLSFRILDTVRLDAASILGLLAFFVNYKFVDLRSSPSAVLLDAIAAIAFVTYFTRLALGYKQTWDRYQLLVNRTLYEKTLASGFGSVHFLLDASEQQQYKEAILAYAVLLTAKDGKVTSHKYVGDACEKFMYENFKEKVKMPVDKAVNTLLRLGLVKEVRDNGNIRLEALPCSEGYEALKHHWDLLLGQPISDPMK